MSYKRVIKKSGKIYGPYRYESYRDENGNVKKRYLGKIEEKHENIFTKKSKRIFSPIKKLKFNKKVFLYLILFIFILLAIILVPKFFSVTGFLVSNESSNSSLSEIESAMIEKNGVSTLQYKAVVNRPVKWLKKITASQKNVSLKLPKGASEISVLTDDEINEALIDSENYKKIVNEIPKEEIIKGSLITGNVILTNKKNIILINFWNWLKSFSMTGKVITTEEIKEDIIETPTSTVVDLKDVASENEEIAVEYYTEAPKANETILNNGKRIVVSAPSELGYTDVLAYSVVEGMGIKMGNPNLKVYWYEDLEDNVVYEEIEEELINDSSILEITEDKEDISNEDLIVEENIPENIVEENLIEESTSKEFIEDNSTKENESLTKENISTEETEEVILGENSINENAIEETIEEETEETIEEVSLSPIDGNVISIDNEKFIENDSSKNREKLEAEVEKYLNPNLKMDRIKKEIEFVPYDFDYDGYVDYIEWIVPHLSVQVYEIIYVIRAEYLDKNRIFIEDVYNEVSSKDGVFTSPIYDGEYLRVVFEDVLNSQKDITIHARSNGTADVLVYEKDEDELIATFKNVSLEDTYKIYLTDLVGSNDTFDLKISGDFVEFDYVVDPSPISLAIPQTFNVNGKLSNATGPLEGTFDFNFSLYNVYSGGSPFWYENMSVTTDSDGVYSAILNVTGLNFSEQYYLGISVEGDAEMTPRLNLTSVPYAFMAQHVYAGGIIFDENIDATGYNITADYFIGDGSLLTGISGGDSLWTNNSGTAEYDGAVVIKL